MEKKNYIIKRLMLLVLAVATASTASAKVVEQAEALQVANRFFSSSGAKTLSTAHQLREIWNSNSLSQGGISLLSNETPTFYVFAPEKGKGFVIVSAEDAVSPIMGYSFEDEAPEGELPCNLEWWCEAMHSQINHMRVEGATATDEVARQWADANVGQDVVLYETAKWNQGSPYNLQCPMDGNSQCVTGCVPTAIAIAMRYHQWPERGVGETESYTVSSNGVRVASRSLEHEYVWDNMLLNYSYGQYTEEQADEVATLMSDIGCLLEVGYTSTATGGGVSPRKLSNHFYYSHYMMDEPCDGYSEENWHELIQTELVKNGPVLYCGYSETVGHQFVLDGFTDNAYYHINWGWGGGFNGYFLLPDIDYNKSQSAVINFIPSDGSDTIELMMRAPGMTLETDVISPNIAFYVSGVYLYSPLLTSFNGSVRLALTNSEGSIKEWIADAKTIENLNGSYSSSSKYVCGITGDINAGDRIRMFYQVEGTDEWKLVVPSNNYYSWEIVISEDMIGNEDSEHVLKMYPPGMTTDAKALSPNVSFNVIGIDSYVCITNTSLTTFTGSVRFALTDSEGNVKEWITSSSSEILSPLSSINIVSWSCNITTELNTGDRIRAFYKTDGTDEWILIIPKTSDCVWEIVYDNANDVDTYEFEVDGIYYNILSEEDLTCEVTYKSSSYNSYSGDVEIPETVTYNGDTYAVTNIGEEAFYNCTGLTSITIPERVTIIGDYAFNGCTSLKSINIPNSVATIGNYAFQGCKGLTAVAFGDGVKAIGDYAFNGCTSLKSLYIGKSVETIGNYAFQSCTGLTELTIPNSVTSIGSYAFYGCSGLTNVTIPESVTEISEWTFCACTGLTSISIPESVTEIGDDAFQACRRLTEVTIPNSVTTIGNGAFFNCSGLIKVTFGDGVMEICGNAFSSCTKLEEVNFGNSLVSIDLNAFGYCSSLTEVTIPNSVTTIGSYAFRDCSGLTMVTFGNGVTEIGTSAFENCIGLTSISIPESVTSLSGFSGCTGLTEVTIPNSVTTIAWGAFEDCTGLANVTIGNSVTSIGGYAFAYCTKLTEVSIPNGVTSIGQNSFEGCTGLIEIIIPSSVTGISSAAFYECSGIERFYSLNPEPPRCYFDDTFYNVPTSTCVLYVPEGSKEAYSTANGWKDFLNIVDNQPNAIEDIMTSGNAEAIGYYTTDGKKLSHPQRGINIIRYSDGTAKKVLVK